MLAEESERIDCERLQYGREMESEEYMNRKSRE
jgi:hypothetical protein